MERGLIKENSFEVQIRDFEAYELKFDLKYNKHFFHSYNAHIPLVAQ